MWFSACPDHFNKLVSAALALSIDDEYTAPAYAALMHHIVADRLLTPAYYTWLGMIAANTDPAGNLSTARLDEPDDPIPDDLVQVPMLVETAVRAAVARDPDNMEAVYKVIADAEPPVTFSFLTSIAATAAISAAVNDACTPEHIKAFLLLGSQTSNGWGAAVLPELVEIVMGQRDVSVRRANPGMLADNFRRLIDVAPGDAHPLTVATDLFSRVLGQMIDNEVIVLDSSTTDIVDVDGSTPENTPREVMASVWAIRASRAYSRAEGPAEAAAAMTALARQRAEPFEFTTDVITAGAMLIAGNLMGKVDTAGSPG